MRICMLLLTAGMLVAGEPSRYEQWLALARKADPRTDYRQLRLSFTETDAYKPYGVEDKAEKEMVDAFGRKDYAAAIASAERILQTKFVDAKAHWVAYRSHSEKGNAEAAKLHQTIFDGLMQSIRKSGDGRSAKTAFVVIAIDEQTVLLELMGIQKKGQALVNEGDQKIDRIDGIDTNTKERVTVYFNVTRQFEWLQKQLKAK